jgi:hypothetical protein
MGFELESHSWFPYEPSDFLKMIELKLQYNGGVFCSLFNHKRRPSVDCEYEEKKPEQFYYFK